MSEAFTGGCACGAVRYELRSRPFDAGYCHCRICQRASGTPVMAFASVPQGDFVVTTGADRIKWFNSTRFGHRSFCAGCGTSLTMGVDHQPDTVDFTLATLDKPDAVAPGFHIFHSSRIDWFDTNDELPRHDRFRPDTRGLEGTEPPA